MITPRQQADIALLQPFLNRLQLGETEYKRSQQNSNQDGDATTKWVNVQQPSDAGNTGFLTGLPSQKEDYQGPPLYKEEEEFIRDQIAKTGIAPTHQDVLDFRSRNDTSQWQFTPESSMGRLGWAGVTESDWRRNSRYGAYGPNAGEYVPDSAFLFTNREGDPAFRTSQLGGDVTGGFLQRGQFFAPPGGLTFEQRQQLEASGTRLGQSRTPPQGSNYFPQRPKPTREELVQDPVTWDAFTSQSDPNAVYKAQLKDYFRQQGNKDFPRFREIEAELTTALERLDAALEPQKQKLEKGLINQEFYDELEKGWKGFFLGDLLTETETLLFPDKMKSILAEVEQQQALGFPPEQLPLFNEIQGIRGTNVMDLFNQFTTQAGTQFQAEQDSKDELYAQTLEAFYQRNPDLRRGDGTEAQPDLIRQTGNERAQYESMINEMGFSPQYAAWARNEFWDLFAEWDRTMPFIDFAIAQWAR